MPQDWKTAFGGDAAGGETLTQVTKSGPWDCATTVPGRDRLGGPRQNLVGDIPFVIQTGGPSLIT
jgi:hypothetical protein